MESLEKVHSLKNELDTLRPISADQEQRILQKFRLDWNYHSNHIEGNSLSYGETKALLLHNITAQGKPLKDHIEMTGHNEALIWLEEVVKNQKPLNETFIRDLHKLILKNPYKVDAITTEGNPTKKWISVGEYKTTPNHVKTKTGEIFYFATPEETPAKMGDLINWFNNEKKKQSFDPVIIASLFHYKFIRIHPFDDGNGRTARILMNFILMQFGYPPVIIKTEDKAEYYSVLQQADADILDPFFDFIGKNLARSLKLMIRAAKGEPIEEPEDLDKEIELLDLQLKSLTKRVEKLKTKETLIEFFQSKLSVILQEFSDAMKLFENYFVQKNFRLQVDQEIVVLPTLVKVQKVIDARVDPALSKIIVQQVFQEMKYSGFEQFGMSIPITISLERSSAEVRCDDWSKIILYDEEFTENDLVEMKRSLKKQGKKVIDSFIELYKKNLSVK